MYMLLVKMFCVYGKYLMLPWQPVDFLLFTSFGAWLFVNIALNQIHKLSLYWYLGSK